MEGEGGLTVCVLAAVSSEIFAHSSTLASAVVRIDLAINTAHWVVYLSTYATFISISM